MPAAAVIRRMQALSGFIGFKGCVGGPLSQRRNTGAQPRVLALKLVDLNNYEAGGMCSVAVKCIDITQKTDCEGIWLIIY